MTREQLRWGGRYVHQGTGGAYEAWGPVTCKTDGPLDGVECVLYVSVPGMRPYVRPVAEFLARFEPAPPPEPTGKQCRHCGAPEVDERGRCGACWERT